MKQSPRTLLAALSSAILASGFGAVVAPSALAAPVLDEEISTIVFIQEDGRGGRGGRGDRGGRDARIPDERPGMTQHPGIDNRGGRGGRDGRGDGRGGRDGRGGNDGRGDHWRDGRGGNDGRGDNWRDNRGGRGDHWRDNRGGRGDHWRDNRGGRDPRYNNNHRPDPRFNNRGSRDWRNRHYTPPRYRNHTPPRYRNYNPPRYRNYSPPRRTYYNTPRNNWRYHTTYYNRGYDRHNYRYYDAGCGASGGDVFAGAILGALFGVAVADDDGAGALFGGLVGAGLSASLNSCDRGQYYYAASYSFDHNQPYYWHNPHSGVRGVVHARDYYNYGGRRCRWGDAEIFMPNGDYTTDRILMCQDRYGRWEVARRQ